MRLFLACTSLTTCGAVIVYVNWCWFFIHAEEHSQAHGSEEWLGNIADYIKNEEHFRIKASPLQFPVFNSIDWEWKYERIEWEITLQKILQSNYS